MIAYLSYIENYAVNYEVSEVSSKGATVQRKGT